MKMKKTIAMLMAGTMLAGSLSASALYSENVPLIDNPRKIGGTSVLEGSGTLDTSAPSTLFTVGGQTFALLDTDEEGNYFVIAEKYFGQRPYWDSMLMDTTLSKAIDNGDGTYDFFWQKPEDIDMDKVRWNPDQEGTVAYWLNNEFLNGANLPSEIKNNIVEHEWQNEAINTNPSGTNWGGDKAIWAIFADEGAENVEASAKANLAQYGYSSVYSVIVNKMSIPAYTTTSKLALLSVSEIKAYADKVGIRPPAGGWQGMMSRTITSFNNVKQENGVYLPQNNLYVGPVQVHGVDNATDATTAQKLSIDHNTLPTNNYYHIRPVFWLDKDFFKNEKIDLTTAGADPLAEVKKYDYYELAMAGYTDEEIESLGIELGIGRPKEIIDPMAGYGNYPEFKANTIAYNNPSWEASARDKYHFSVAVDDVTTKNFVLLDRDANGNYLVLAEDNYGAYKFYDCAEADELNSYDFTADDWNYDPARENSVAYYLDNDFLTTGYGQNMPESVKENILGVKAGTTKPTWKVENHRIYGKPTYATEGINKTKYEQWLAGNNDDIREFQSSVVLPSYTEVMTYSDKIMVNYTDWKGPMTRTTLYYIQPDTENGVDIINARFWRMYTDPASGKNKLCVDGEADLNTGATYSVRPMFWLDKDFFKNEKVVATDIGSEVAKQIMQYNVADMDDLYTAAELEAIGYTNLPTITTPSIKGNVVVGQPLTVDYTFSSPVAGATEKGTTIQWYIADDAEGPWTAIEGATDKTYTIKDTDLDKYVKVEVIPMDILNSIGARSESEVKLLTEASLFEVDGTVFFLDGNGEELTTLNGATSITAMFGIKNANPSAVTKSIIIAVYDKDGNMIKMNSVDTEIASSQDFEYYDITLTLDKALGADCTCKAMIWDTMDSMVPVAMGEFVPAV